MSEKRVFFGEDAPFNWIDGLQQLIAAIPTRGAAVEVGCFAGVSTECLAQAFEFVTAVDVWKPYREVMSEETISEARRMFDERMQKYPNVSVFPMESPLAAAHWMDGSIDFVYIDANHSYFEVLSDITAWWPKVKMGGFIGGHDYHQPGVYAAVSHALGTPHGLYPDTSWLKKKEV